MLEAETEGTVGPLKTDVGNEEVIVEDEEAAEVLNTYFSSVFTLEDLGNIPEPKQTWLFKQWKWIDADNIY